jgi:hypothetical protein
VTSSSRKQQPTPIDLAREARRLEQLRQANRMRDPHDPTAGDTVRAAYERPTDPKEAA